MITPPLNFQTMPSIGSGGGWSGGDKRRIAMQNLSRYVASKGFVCFTVNYRLAPASKWPAHLEDVRSAVQWVREHGHKYGADTKSFVALGGVSAGAHIAVLAAMEEENIGACLLIEGVYDLLDDNKYFHFHLEAFLKSTLFQEYLFEQVKKASPVHVLQKKFIDEKRTLPFPLLFLHGEVDGMVPIRIMHHFFDKCKRVSNEPYSCLSISVPHAGHGFASLLSPHGQYA